MNKNFNIKNRPSQIFSTYAAFCTIFVLTFISAFIASSALAPIDESNAETTRVELPNGYYVEASSDDIDLSLNTTPDGALAIR